MPPVDALADRIRRLPLWAAIVLAIPAGALGVLAMAPYGHWWVLVPSFTVLVWLVEGARSDGRAFLVGWAFAFGFHLFGLTWVAHAFRVEADLYAWMIPIVVTGLPAGLALFAGLAAIAYRRLRSAGAWRILGFAAMWTAAEWLRGHVLTGFPWNLAAYAWVDVPGVQQAAAFVGSYGLTLLTVAAAAAPAVLLPAIPGVPRGRPAIPIAAMAALVALIWAGGEMRLGRGAVADVPGVTLRIVQPSIPQELKWRPEHRAAIFAEHLRLTAAPGADAITHAIWPEAAPPFLLDEVPEALAAIAEIAPPGGVLTGSPRRDGDAYFNSAFLVDSDGRADLLYDKHHLVPFGEYVPLRDLLPLDTLVAQRGGFESGPGPRTVQVPGLPPVSILICYEVIFPGAAAARGERPGWLLNLTNDAWFGDGYGPRQHFAIARMRAVEGGLPLVRAANTGISAVIDPYGRVLETLSLGRVDVLDTALPEALPPTLYARLGDWTTLGLIVLALAISLVGRRRQARPG